MLTKIKNMKNHAKNEFHIFEKVQPDAVVLEFKNEIMALVNNFMKSGQSGGSVHYVAATISETVKNLCLAKTITPLTGENDEWVDVGYFYQNKRMSNIFKYKYNNKAYNIDAIVWVSDTYSFTGSVYLDNNGKLELVNSKLFINIFPFTPKTFYIEIENIPLDKNFAIENDILYDEIDGNCFYANMLKLKIILNITK